MDIILDKIRDVSIYRLCSMPVPDILLCIGIVGSILVSYLRINLILNLICSMNVEICCLVIHRMHWPHIGVLIM